MTDIVVGIIAVLVGVLLCFRGYLAMRALISLWGAFVGFLLGAGLVAGLTGSGFLSAVLGWIVGIVVAILFGVLAYLSYQVAVVLGMAAIGFTVGTSIMAAFRVQWSWLTVLVGVAAGVLLAVIAIAGDLPAILLAVLTAVAGASVVVFGLMLIVGLLNAGAFTAGDVTAKLDTHWWWYAGYLVLVLAGIIAQGTHLSRAKASMRQQWYGAQYVPAPPR
ncbi:TM7S3/TM198-like domain-containing protein [Microlunatus ginsengisoli]|uniref:DUF4203 domain-containing protein n=1 Tax=Microlunatus ginsengisoli TaxID=363863 RepID=A0ABP7ACB1_9ACTN